MSDDFKEWVKERPNGSTTGMGVNSTLFPKAEGLTIPITAVQANGSRSNS